MLAVVCLCFVLFGNTMTDQSCQHDQQFHVLTSVSVGTVFVEHVAMV